MKHTLEASNNYVWVYPTKDINLALGQILTNTDPNLFINPLSDCITVKHYKS
ncbi:hypothetical protein MARI151_20575 [Maribacter litoralis]|uniref:Uncharacterized protein n=1 Tax=Maribacter litoralis TaxID=2059726 RepID=A0A653QJU7_9FLAO|nr:hypothetical protein MARI151_20575 [Maribacter litoralis]